MALAVRGIDSLPLVVLRCGYGGWFARSLRPANGDSAPPVLSGGDPNMATPSMQQFAAGPLSFVVRHELWDGNIQDHADQGVTILVNGNVAGKETTLLRFNCFDIEKSYVYGPENPDLKHSGPMMLEGRMTAPTAQIYRMDPVTDGNPIGWTVRTLGTKLRKMLDRAGYPQMAEIVDMAEVRRVLPSSNLLRGRSILRSATR
jgi:hypothetical protein